MCIILSYSIPGFYSKYTGFGNVFIEIGSIYYLSLGSADGSRYPADLTLAENNSTVYMLCNSMLFQTFSSCTNIRLNAFTAVNYWRSGTLHLYWWYKSWSLPVGRHRNFVSHSTVGHCWAKIGSDSSLFELACLSF